MHPPEAVVDPLTPAGGIDAVHRVLRIAEVTIHERQSDRVSLAAPSGQREHVGTHVRDDVQRPAEQHDIRAGDGAWVSVHGSPRRLRKFVDGWRSHAPGRAFPTSSATVAHPSDS
jgi:hypothetical protein